MLYDIFEVDWIDAAPLWAWLLLGFALGFACYWVYRLCMIAEFGESDRTDAQRLEGALEDANAAVDKLHAQLKTRDDELSTTRGEAIALRAELAKPAAPTEDPLLAEALRLARYRHWVAEERLLRLRSEFEARPAPAPVVVVQEPEPTRQPVAPSEDVSALKYQNWLMANRLAKLSATSGAAFAPRPKRRTVGLPAAEVVDGPTLRYRNWLLTEQLSATLEAAQNGRTADLAAIDAALAEAATERPNGSNASHGQVVELAAAPDRTVSDALEAARAEARKLSFDNSGLRYRNWLLGGAVGQAIGVLRAGAAPEQAPLERALADAGIVETAPPNGPAAAAGLASSSILIPQLGVREVVREVARDDVASKAAATTLRRRVATLEGELGRLRQRALAVRSEPTQDPTALRRRLWRAEWERRRLAFAPSPPTTQGPSDDVLAAALEDANALRSRATTAEKALQDLRDEIASAPTPAPTIVVDQAALDEANSMRQRAMQSEAALRELRAEIAAAPPPPTADPEQAEKLRRALHDAADLRSRLWTAEWRLQSTRAAAADVAVKPVQVQVPVPPPPAKRTPVPIATLPEEPRAFLPERPRMPPPLMLDDPDAGEGVDIEAPLSGAEAAALEIIEAERVQASSKPTNLLDRAEGGAPDDLKLIKGVGPQLEGLLNGLGVYHFDQLAQLTPGELAWIDAQLGFRGRVVRDRWAPQAEFWARRKAAGALGIGPEGSWTELDGVAGTPPLDRAPIADGAAEAAREETVETLAPPSETIMVPAPLSGAEAAAAELIDSGRFLAIDAARPANLLETPSYGAPDNLKLIAGVGPKLEGLLNGLGVYYFAQIADFGPTEMAWVDAKLALRGRIVRDRWIPQAIGWRDRKGEGALHIGPEETWTALGAQMISGAAGASGLADVERRVSRPAAIAPGRTPSPAPIAQSAAGVSEADAIEQLRTAMRPAPARLRGQEPLLEIERAAARIIETSDGVAPAAHRPYGLLAAAPRDGADDLKLLAGVGPEREAQLNEVGVFLFDQVARLSASELAWLDVTLGLDGRSVADRWAPRSRMLARRKNEGGLRLGPEGLWTVDATPAPLADIETVAASAPMTAAEEEASALIRNGFAADAARRPSGLMSSPRVGPPDDLKQISGVGPKLEALLNELGLYYFRQISTLSGADIAWIDAKLRFDGRIVRDRWVVQAAELDRRR